MLPGPFEADLKQTYRQYTSPMRFEYKTQPWMWLTTLSWASFLAIFLDAKRRPRRKGVRLTTLSWASFFGCSFRR